MISGESPGHFYRNVFALIVLGMKICVSCRLWAVILLSPRGKSPGMFPWQCVHCLFAVSIESLVLAAFGKSSSG